MSDGSQQSAEQGLPDASTHGLPDASAHASETHPAPADSHAHNHPPVADSVEKPAAVEPEVVEPEIEEEEGDVKPISEDVQGPEEIDRKWYILKIQSNREESIKEGLQRRVAIAGLDRYFGDIIVPTETVTEFKGGKKKVVKRKLYPGYLVVNMEINDDTWFVVRETPGIGDFTGRIGRPTPMAASDIAKIMSTQVEETAEQPKMKIKFNKGDRVKIKEGTFENFEGDVDEIDEANGRVTVMINIFGRSTPVELEHWQVEAV